MHNEGSRNATDLLRSANIGIGDRFVRDRGHCSNDFSLGIEEEVMRGREF